MSHPQIEKLAKRVFESKEEQDSFVRAIEDPPEIPSAVINLTGESLPFDTLEKLAGQPPFVERVDLRASKHPLHESGGIYCLDYSSVFAASVLLAIPPKPEVVLDVCAAPGGKSVFAWKALGPEILLSNEIVIGRAKALISNLKRCSIPRTKVLNFSSERLAQALPKACDTVILDVPCSGQSLMVKGKNLSGTFHSHVVSGNVKRQRRILAQSSECVKPGGYLAYMTCTFAPDENEKNLEWFLKKFPAFEAVDVAHLEEFRSHLADFPCYRIWPHRQPVAGSFTALFKNKEGSPRHSGATEASSSVDLISELRPIWES